MTIETLLAHARDLGLTFADNRIHGPTEHAHAVAALIREHGLRDAVQRATRPVECLWPRGGYVCRKDFAPWPTGAYFWRFVGDVEWVAIPGRVWDAEKREGVVEKVSSTVEREVLKLRAV